MNKINYDTIYRAAWWLLVVTLPMTTPVTSFFNLLLAVVWLADLRFAEKWERLKCARWVIPFLLFFALHLLGVAYSENIGVGFFEVEKKLAFLSLPVIAASGRPLTISDFNFFSKSFIYSCLSVVVLSFIFIGASVMSNTLPASLNFDTYTNEQFHALNPSDSSVWEYFSYITIGDWIDMHPAYFSMYIIFCMAILAQKMFDEMRMNYLSLAMLGAFTLFIGLLSSRMAIVSYALVLLYLTIFNLSEKKDFKITVVPVVFIFLLSGLIWINPVSRFRILQEPLHTSYRVDPSATHWNSVSYRLLEWSASLNELKNSWLTGVGTGDGQAALQRYYSRYGPGVMILNYNAHNQYLQTTLELGLGGLFLLVLCIYRPVFTLAQRYPVHIAFVLLFGLMCITESVLARQKGIVFFAMFQSLFFRCMPL